MTLDWQNLAACVDQDIELFFIPKGANAQPAKKICSKCPVKRECLDYAMRRCEMFGIWGGLTSWERQKLRRRSRAA